MICFVDFFLCTMIICFLSVYTAGSLFHRLFCLGRRLMILGKYRTRAR